MTQGGKQPTFSHTSDRHSILIYRELSGFPAYTLSRLITYYNKYMDETRRENTPPLQMLTRDPLPHISVPTSPVLSRYVIAVVEALALGTVIFDKENYYMVTLDEWCRRTLAIEAQVRGDYVEIEDRRAGSERKIGKTLKEATSRLSEKLPETAIIFSQQQTYKDVLEELIREWKRNLKPEMHCDLLESLYFEGILGTNSDNIDIETDIRPAVVFILKRDFGLEEEHIQLPPSMHQELLRGIHISSKSNRQSFKSKAQIESVK
jgi:hypothetical protein